MEDKPVFREIVAWDLGSLGEIARRGEISKSGSESTNQVSLDGNYHIAMLDSSADHAELLLDGVRAVGVSATAFQTKQDLLRFLGRQDVDLAVVVFHSKSWWRDELRLFCNSVRHFQENAEIICILTWPEECPLDRLYGDTLNVSVLHG